MSASSIPTHKQAPLCGDATMLFQSANERVFDSNRIKRPLRLAGHLGFQSANERVFDSNCSDSRWQEARVTVFQSANERVFDSIKPVISGQSRAALLWR